MTPSIHDYELPDLQSTNKDLTFGGKKSDFKWIPLFPEYKTYRFLGVENSHIWKDKSTKKIFFKPILLVNGYQSNHLTWNFLAKKLWNLGFRNIFALELLDYTINRDDLYSLIDSVIKTILSSIPIFKKIIIIAHSAGGIVGRYYVKRSEIENERNVSMIIALASPHYGLLHSLKHNDAILNKFFKPGEMKLFDDVSELLNLNEVKNQQESTFVTMINVHGSVKLLGGSDGLFRPQPVSEMINYKTNKSHFKMNKNYFVVKLIRDFLLKSVCIYKIELTSINFPTIEIIHKIDMFFEIQTENGTKQRFPLEKELEISSKINHLEIPQVIFVGKIDDKNKKQTVKLSAFRSKTLLNELLIEKKIPIQYTDNNRIIKKIRINNQLVDIGLKIISYSLEKEI